MFKKLLGPSKGFLVVGTSESLRVHKKDGMVGQKARVFVHFFFGKRVLPPQCVVVLAGLSCQPTFWPVHQARCAQRCGGHSGVIPERVSYIKNVGNFRIAIIRQSLEFRPPLGFEQSLES